MADTPTLRVAGWLLARLLAPTSASVLTGDLAEQQQRGRSSWWVWRQTIGAIVVAGWEDLRLHPVLSARATAVACVAYAAIAFLSVWWLEARSFSIWAQHGLIGSWYFLAAFIAARCHRRVMAGVTVALVALLLVMTIPDLARVLRNSLEHPRYLPYLWDRALYFAVAFGNGGLGLILGASLRPKASSGLQPE